MTWSGLSVGLAPSTVPVVITSTWNARECGVNRAFLDGASVLFGPGLEPRDPSFFHGLVRLSPEPNPPSHYGNWPYVTHEGDVS
ncbi:hypothetical protein GCM10018785_45980 [Streptomyces longispororuber]|uniref:Uncharacterized protein n=1 Tax=Streptomyces longispororuber TaxID=68230 RepID=A0A919DSH2_9ACTN|nr:hypothetical protein GCM10018785_45980 [Streptomyces longispororuber]